MLWSFLLPVVWWSSGDLVWPVLFVCMQIPASAFWQAYAVAQPFNALVDSISRDSAWILQVLERYGRVCGRVDALMLA